MTKLLDKVPDSEIMEYYLAEAIEGMTVADDVVTDPGRFEGESVMVPYFHNLMMVGDGEVAEDEYGTVYTIISVNPAEAIRFDIESDRVALWTSEQGFVYCVPYFGELDEVA